jgi:hypothetical protein
MRELVATLDGLVCNADGKLGQIRPLVRQNQVFEDSVEQGRERLVTENAATSHPIRRFHSEQTQRSAGNLSWNWPCWFDRVFQILEVSQPIETSVFRLKEQLLPSAALVRHDAEARQHSAIGES